MKSNYQFFTLLPALAALILLPSTMLYAAPSPLSAPPCAAAVQPDTVRIEVREMAAGEVEVRETVIQPVPPTDAELRAERKAAKKKTKVHVSLRDSLDNKFDLSDWIITKKGFFPMPILITESALGGFGGGVAPIFISPKAPLEYRGKIYPVMPDITTIAGAYTLNNTWFVGGARVGMIRPWRTRYKVAAGYANVNMDFYHTFPDVGEKKFDVNMRTIPVYGYLGKLMPNPRWELGLEYVYVYTKAKLNVPDDGGYFAQYVASKELKSGISMLGLRVSYDSRDNTFTPDRGIKTYLHGRWSGTEIGSDYEYGNLEGALYWFFNCGRRKQFVTGVRFDIQQMLGSGPFYVKPYVDMRGVPSERYQGKSTMLLEVEQRWDVVRRWSVLAFGGTGKAFDSYSDFGSADWAWGSGVGFRYLMARKLKLRVGVDLAMGPQGFAYYLVFGSSWMRQ